ncbi:MAG: hypothetical protein A2521_05225 [Deltaproteobacteria bacterium RIFOXYD12_FULL_57_12]|nr:MAG: hypothetical protein A2521_05225 [Deltaproteobacteria bacterium RIFOXYD12_FULL_57_12]
MPKNFVQNIKLDARPDRLDLRDRTYSPPVKSLPAQWPPDETLKQLLPEYVAHDLILDQGKEGACTGFGLACMINYLLWRRHIETSQAPFATVSPRMLYHLARFYDEWPGEDYEGSSCRGALKAWHKHGVCADERWPYRDPQGNVVFIPPQPGWETDAVTRTLGVYYRVDKNSVVDMQAAIYQVGAIYVSANVHAGWNLASRKKPVSHAALPVIAPKTRIDGGHAFAIVGFNEHGFIVQNSWSPAWGAHGFAILPYRDWVKNGTDAWVCGLGVPRPLAEASSHFISSTAGLAAVDRAGNLWGGDLWGGDNDLGTGHTYHDPAVVPWTTAQAYQHTVVMGNNGRLINRLVTAENGAAGLEHLACTEPAAWFAGRPGAKRLLIYAHGGLNSEDESVARIRMLAPYFKENGVYPIFLTWKTGPLESLTDIVADELAKALSLTAGIGDIFTNLRRKMAEALDRKIEAICEMSPVKSMWTQMKQNALEAASPTGGGRLIVEALVRLKAQHPELEIHLAGHSAGSIILGHMLDVFAAKGLCIATCSLFAPACSIAFANRHYAGVARQPTPTLDRRHLHIHLLTDERELADTVGPYGKSLLYLVSRALEECHKMPLMGMANAFDPAKNATAVWNQDTRTDLETWQTFWNNTPNLHQVATIQVNTGPRRIASAHGAFDNDINVMSAVIMRITGQPPVHAVENLDY